MKSFLSIILDKAPFRFGGPAVGYQFYRRHAFLKLNEEIRNNLNQVTESLENEQQKTTGLASDFIRIGDDYWNVFGIQTPRKYVDCR